MSCVRFIKLKAIFLLVPFLCTGMLLGQSDSLNDQNKNEIDTSDYIPFFYDRANDINLMIAASKGYPSEIDRLIQKGADIEAETFEGATPLVFAVSNNKISAVSALLAHKPVIDKITANYETPLLIAVKSGFIEVAEKLIRAGADVNFKDRNGAVPLHYACLYGYLDIVDMLLYYDAEKDIKSHDGTTPLLVTVWAGNPSEADLLLQNGVDPEARDNEGYTPFLLASGFGDTLIMDLLYKKGADIYHVNNKRYNALTLALMAHQDSAVKYLLRIGNKWQDQNKIALDPYTVASIYRNKEGIGILKSEGIPGKIHYGIDHAAITLSSRFFLHDFYSGISFSIPDPYLNIGLIAGLDAKLWYTRILMKSENIYYQYYNKGFMAYAGPYKEFILSDHPGRHNLSLSTSLLAGYSFGNTMKGSSFTPENKFNIIPALNLKFSMVDFSFSMGVEYLKSGFYHTGPVWLRLGVSYNYYFEKVMIKIKPPKWFLK